MSSPRYSNEQLLALWQRLSAENWGGGPCPEAEREPWIQSIAMMSGATMERVEGLGLQCGVLTAGVTGWEWASEAASVTRGEDPPDPAAWLTMREVAARLELCHRHVVDSLRRKGVSLQRNDRGHWLAARAEVEALALARAATA